jgi:DNA-binding SARP family transcriptional activator
MTTRGEPAPEGPSEGQAGWRTAGELLKAGQYERVAQLLRDAQVDTEQTGDASLAEILAATYQICMVCSSCQAEAERHQRAYEEANRREYELKQQLQAMLDLVSEREAPETREKRATPAILPTAKLSLPAPDVSETAPRPGLWQHIQSLLRLRPGSRSLEQEGPVVSVRAPVVGVAPPAKIAEIPTPASAGKVELPPAPPVTDEQQQEQSPPSFMVYCLGPFRLYQDDLPVEDWSSSKGKSVFKYLVTHRERPVAKEVLMDLFWPDANPDAARNNLNVAMYGLRQTLYKIRPHFPHVLFQDEYYLFNPALQIWVDVEEFIERFQTAQNLEGRGELARAVREYRTAEALYQGEFLEEDRYEDWLLPQRQRLQDRYLNLLDRLSRHYFDQENYDACATMCEKMLVVDPCREEAHRRLMRYYSQQKQRYLALRQYHLCVEALARLLDVSPDPTTIALYNQIRQSQ